MGTIEMNPYKAQKAWPPNFAHLDAKHQFRLERKFRRRSKLKFVRPRWVKGVKLAQWGLCLGVGAWCILFMDWGLLQTPFPRVRDWVNKSRDSVWTMSSSQPATRELDLRAEETNEKKGNAS